MDQVVAFETLAGQLELALKGNELPVDVQKLGFRLQKRLNTPVRVAIFGTDADRCLGLANAFLGRKIIPQGRRFPAIELRYGAKERTSFLSSQDIVSTIDGLVFDLDVASDVTLIRVEMPSNILQSMSFIVVSFVGLQENFYQEIEWAQDQTDIALWCTQEFCSREQNLWSRVRDDLKDNSYLVLTDADSVFGQNIAAAKNAQLNEIVAAEFYGMFSATTGTDRTTSNSNSAVNHHSDDVDAITRVLAKRVSIGRKANADNVLLFLTRYGILAESPDHNDTFEPVTAPPKPDKVLSLAHTMLLNGAAQLSVALNFIGTCATSEILGHCLDVSNQLGELFAQNEAAADLQEAFWEVSDLLTLMQLEGDDTAAADAVTLLLQMKWDIAGRMEA